MMESNQKHLEIKLTDNGEETSMNAEIKVGMNTTPELLEDMINAFENMREGLYKQARERIEIIEQAKKDERFQGVRKEVQDADS